MIRVPIPIVAALLLTACGAEAPRVPIAPKKEPAAQAAGYAIPAMVTRVEAGPAGLTLTGSAPAGAPIRLASPDGAAMVAKADDKGVWRLGVPAAAQPRLFGLSSTQGARTVQAQGYLLLTPDGRGYLLRSGAGAVRVGPVAGLAITAFDFDREGAAVVSGAAGASATITVRADGRQSADGRADAAGRFAISLSQPLAAGEHTIKIYSDGAENSATIDTSPAASLVDGPFRSSTTPAGLRVDWMTPGGGVQSTVILN
ncbi:Ig-like domain-containing protein [Phenylobacterium sp.]|uniref:Ig-like domain-containing protein n=1 Tax=Phenylobacterium sp. TaxID=1871053 RepID=UPI003BAC9DB0